MVEKSTLLLHGRSRRALNMPHGKMIWIVIAANPWPDKYVPILVRSQKEAFELCLRLEKFEVFTNEQDAISFATRLKEKYNAKSVRIFYSEGHSKKITL